MGSPAALVQVRLYTGRTHQIRVQFASRQLPLLGDIRYGSKDPGCTAALWSYHLGFRHPVTGKPVDVTCPPPPGVSVGFVWRGKMTESAGGLWGRRCFCVVANRRRMW